MVGGKLEKVRRLTPNNEHHLCSVGVGSGGSEDLGALQDAEDSVAQPEATIAGEGGSTEHIVPPQLCRKRQVLH